MAILNGKWSIPSFPSYSLDLLNLIRCLLQIDSDKRPTIWNVQSILKDLRTSLTSSQTILNASPLISETKSLNILIKKDSIIQKDSTHSKSSSPIITPMRRGRPTAKTLDSFDPLISFKDENSSSTHSAPLEDPFVSISKRSSCILELESLSVPSLEELDPFSQLAMKSVSKTT